jgi:hypothetical protein
LLIFEIGSHFMLHLACTVILLCVLSCTSEMMGANYHIQPLVEMGS